MQSLLRTRTVTAPVRILNILPTIAIRPVSGIPVLRTMSSSAAPAAPASREWLVITPDFEGALQKRLDVRPQHLTNLKADREGFWLFGGAILEEPINEGEAPKMKGSAMLIGANTREEVLERLKNDVYGQSGVWDLSQVQIIPFKTAIRKAL